MKKIILVTFLFCGLTIFSQETKTAKSQLDFGADFQSRYVWRGLNPGGSSPSIQPSMSLTSGILTLGAWGAYSTGGVNKFQEADLYLTLAASKKVAFTLTDYYFPKEGISNNYFKYGTTTGHILELMLTVGGSDSFPISFTAATNFAGADKNGTKQSYSTYLEAKYDTKIGDTAFSVVAGGVFSDNGGFYQTNGSGLINLSFLAAKEIKLSSTFSLPVNTGLTLNPDQGNIYFTFGFSL